MGSEVAWIAYFPQGRPLAALRMETGRVAAIPGLAWLACFNWWRNNQQSFPKQGSP
jgi:hypothetical protein